MFDCPRVLFSFYPDGTSCLFLSVVFFHWVSKNWTSQVSKHQSGRNGNRPSSFPACAPTSAQGWLASGQLSTSTPSPSQQSHGLENQSPTCTGRGFFFLFLPNVQDFVCVLIDFWIISPVPGPPTYIAVLKHIERTLKFGIIKLDDPHDQCYWSHLMMVLSSSSRSLTKMVK